MKNDSGIKFTDVNLTMIRFFPNFLRPYVFLARLDRPVGIFLLLLPCFWSFSLNSRFFNFDSLYLIYLYFTFFLGAILMRSAGCVINDLVDYNIDKKVYRTKFRPLASGLISKTAAIFFVSVLFLMGAILLFSFDRFTIFNGFCAVFLIILYPFAKRWMSLPQVVLGVTFNWGIFMANSALTQEVSLYSLVLFVAAFFWTVGYDSIYGILDYEYDKKIKVKSSVVKFGQYTDVFVVFCYGMFLLLMVFLGYLINAGILYYGILLLVTLHMFWQIKTITFTNLEKNLEVFKSNFYVGILIWIALLLS